MTIPTLWDQVLGNLTFRVFECEWSGTRLLGHATSRTSSRDVPSRIKQHATRTCPMSEHVARKRARRGALERQVDGTGTRPMIVVGSRSVFATRSPRAQRVIN